MNIKNIEKIYMTIGILLPDKRIPKKNTTVRKINIMNLYFLSLLEIKGKKINPNIKNFWMQAPAI